MTRTRRVANPPPDGYQLLFGTVDTMAIAPALYKKLPYDSIKDFTPLGLIVARPAGFVVHPSMPVRSVKEFIAFARARPGQILYSTSGPGAVGHMSAELFASMTGIKFLHVPYKGAGPSVIDLVAGHVQTTFASLPLLVGHIQSGRLRILAQCGAKRSDSLPEVPTMQEAGVPGFVVSSGFSFIGPAGIPRANAERLNAALLHALRDPPTRKQLVTQAADPIGNSIDEHAAFIKSEIAKWTKVARQANITID